jgi:hypothetical protein
VRGSTIWKRAALILAVALGALFLLRGAWLATEGLAGRIQFDRQDWLQMALFVLAGIRLLLFARRRFRSGW